MVRKGSDGSKDQYNSRMGEDRAGFLFYIKLYLDFQTY